MNKRQKIIIVISILILGGYFAYDYVYKDHRDIGTEESSLEIAATYLLERFKTGDGNDLLNRTITVSGTVTQLEKLSVTLNGSVYCSFASESFDAKSDKKLRIKGRCIGYDDLFDVVKLDQCIILND